MLRYPSPPVGAAGRDPRVPHPAQSQRRRHGDVSIHMSLRRTGSSAPFQSLYLPNVPDAGVHSRHSTRPGGGGRSRGSVTVSRIGRSPSAMASQSSSATRPSPPSSGTRGPASSGGSASTSADRSAVGPEASHAAEKLPESRGWHQ